MYLSIPTEVSRSARELSGVVSKQSHTRNPLLSMFIFSTFSSTLRCCCTEAQASKVTFCVSSAACLSFLSWRCPKQSMFWQVREFIRQTNPWAFSAAKSTRSVSNCHELTRRVHFFLAEVSESLGCSSWPASSKGLCV